MGVYRIGDKWDVDLYIDGRRKRKAIGSRKEGRSIKRTGEFIFANPNTGKPISDLQTYFKADCRKAGISDLRFHDLQHTAAKYMVTGGIDFVTVKEILGHATIQMTMRYAHPTPKNKRRAVDVLAKLFTTVGDRPGHLNGESAQITS